MRINKCLALATGLSRRAADDAIAAKRVSLNGAPAHLGQDVAETDQLSLDGKLLDLAKVFTAGSRLIIMLNKPTGYVVSRNGQGSLTVYDLLPPEYQSLKPAGRLDKDSSGLLLFTNDGQLAYELTHPSQKKPKVYEVTLDKPLLPAARAAIETGLMLEDGPSKLSLAGNGVNWTVKMSEGRNRQIRRTFAALGYKLIKLHRISFDKYSLDDLGIGETRSLA